MSIMEHTENQKKRCKRKNTEGNGKHLILNELAKNSKQNKAKKTVFIYNSQWRFTKIRFSNTSVKCGNNETLSIWNDQEIVC